MTDERAIIKLCLKTGAGSSHGKPVQAPIRCVILHSVYDSLGRLAIASERTASMVNKFRRCLLHSFPFLQIFIP